MITSPRSNYMISGKQPGWTDNQRVGNTLSHMQNLGYHLNYSRKYVLTTSFCPISGDITAMPGRTELKEKQHNTVKFLKFDHPNNCCNYCKIRTRWLYHRVVSPKDADRMANNVDPDQTAPLIWVYTICPGLFPKIITVTKKNPQ